MKTAWHFVPGFFEGKESWRGIAVVDVAGPGDQGYDGRPFADAIVAFTAGFKDNPAMALYEQFELPIMHDLPKLSMGHAIILTDADGTAETGMLYLDAESSSGLIIDRERARAICETAAAMSHHRNEARRLGKEK